MTKTQFYKFMALGNLNGLIYKNKDKLTMNCARDRKKEGEMHTASAEWQFLSDIMGQISKYVIKIFSTFKAVFLR